MVTFNLIFNLEVDGYIVTQCSMDIRLPFMKFIWKSEMKFTREVKLNSKLELWIFVREKPVISFVPFWAYKPLKYIGSHFII